MCVLVRTGFGTILLDNDEIYINQLKGIIESIDEYAHIQIKKSTEKVSVRIAPSLPKYNEMLLAEILKFHNMLHIQLDISKSIKSSATLFFKIVL